MRRKDRELTELHEILTILDEADTLYLAMQGEEGPYAVPMSFGWEREGENTAIYIHGAAAGRKAELLAKDPRVCVTASRFVHYDQTRFGITARYESVVGFGTARVLEEPAARLHALDKLCEHCGFTGFDSSACASLAATRVWKLTLTELTGKRNRRPLPQEG